MARGDEAGPSLAPRRAALTTDELVRAALRVIGEVGVEGLTMRQLAEELGVTPMAAYYYVKSKEELLDLAVVAALGEEREAHLALVQSGDWESYVRERVRSTFHGLARYPGLAAFATTRPISPAFRETGRRAVQVLEDAGLSHDEAVLANATVHTYSFGLAALEAQFRPRRRSADRAILADVDVDAFIDYGLDLLIAGIRDKIARARQAGAVDRTDDQDDDQEGPA